MPLPRLGINIDHVATLRNARNRDAMAQPDLLRAAQEAIKGGAQGITFHLREDRRHMLDKDVVRLRKNIKTPINLEIAPTAEMVAIARKIKPHAVCLVPEKRREVTTEGGLDIVRGGVRLARIVTELAAAGIRVSLFINADPQQVMAAYVAGAAVVEFHTGAYAHATGKQQQKELHKLRVAAGMAHELGIEVHAGHGLTYDNVSDIAAIPDMAELNIGHFLIGEAVFCGLQKSVRQMKRLIKKAWTT